MICNQGPLSLGSTIPSSSSANSNLEDFLSQYLSKKESKFQSIQQTLHKAETQCSTPHAKSDKGLTFKQASLNHSHNSHDSSVRLSNQTVQTNDSSSKTSPGSSATPQVSTMLEVLAEENVKRTESKKLSIGYRNKARTMDKHKGDSSNRHAQSRSRRILGESGFLSPFRSKSSRGSNKKASFISDNIIHSSRIQSPTDFENHLISEEEDMEGFLMIKPIKTGTSHPKQHQPIKSQNFCLNLDDTLFPKEILDHAKSLQEANFGAYVRAFIGYIYSFRDQNRAFSTKRPISEALYSIFFEGETLDMFKKLLDQVLGKLKEESITLKQKYRTEIEFIEAKHAKLLRNTASSIKFEEKDLQKLQAKIVTISQERCLMDSISELNLIHHFLQKILEKFPSICRPNALKLGKNVIIDNITLPKLLEKLVESSNASAAFYKTITIYTYDLFTTAQNLMIYLILRYFEPEPLTMTASELRMYRNEVLKTAKIHILKLIKYWIEERKGDFMRVPDIITILNTFLDLVRPIEKDSEIKDLIKNLTESHEQLSQDILKYKQKLCEKVDNDKQIVMHPHANSFTQPGGKPDVPVSLLSRVITNSEGSYPLSAREREEVSIIRQNSNVFDLKSKPFVDTNPFFTSRREMTPQAIKSNDSTQFFSLNPGSQTPGKFSFLDSFNNGFNGFYNAKAKAPYDYKRFLEEESGTLAKYLTVIDWKYFSKIDISEMICKRWTKQDKVECPSYWKYVRRFNSLCSWIQYIVLLHESLRRRQEIAQKLLEVALICLRTYNNYTTSQYIFAALSSLQEFGVISLKENLAADYEVLKKTFVPAENFLVTYREKFGAMKAPAIPHLNFFLQSFLKLQDGVIFWAKLPESNRLRYLKFPLIVQIHSSCKEMRRFQKSGYEKMNVSMEDDLYKFLKKGFRKGLTFKPEDKDETLHELTKMVKQVMEKQNKLTFFGVKTFY